MSSKSLHAEWVRYGDNQQYTGYLVKPARANEPLPAIVVIQEIWGVDTHIQNVTERFAQAGYAAFAPDLYSIDGQRPAVLQADRLDAVKNFIETMPPGAWHNVDERNAALAKLPGDEGARIGETFGALFGGASSDRYVPYLVAATDFLRNECEYSKGQPVMSIGYCMGGALSARLACHDPGLNGAVIFYGTAPSVDFIDGIQCPVRGFYGGLDPRITDAVPQFAQAMKQAGKDFEHTVYEGAHHAFFNDTRGSYHPSASRDAFAQVLQFFNTRSRG